MQNVKNGVIYLMIGFLNSDDHVKLVNDPEAKLYKLLRTIDPESIFLRLTKSDKKFEGIASFRDICATYTHAVKNMTNEIIVHELPIIMPILDKAGNVVKEHWSTLLYNDVYKRVTTNNWTTPTVKMMKPSFRLEMTDECFTM